LSATETVTGKITPEQKELLQKYGVNTSKLIREAVEKEIQRIQEEEQKKALLEAARILKKIPDHDIVDIIRENRESR
jgi:post-segregation antitoxin (ccd killing protein)